MCESDFHLRVSHKLLSKCREINKDGNVFISPVSISLGILSVAFGTKGNSRQQISHLLNLNPEVTDEELISVSSAFSALNEDLKLANGIFVDKTYSINQNYLQNLAKTNILLDSKEVDFKTNNQNVLAEINNWVEKATNSKIKDFLNEIDQDTKIILINAIHFKGQWLEEFDKNFTSKKPFHLSTSKSHLVDMMFVERNFQTIDCEELDCRCIELPYTKDSISCYILLPNKIEGLSIIDAGFTPELFNKMLMEMEGNKPKIELSLPKFKIECSLDLETLLLKLGVIDIFQRGIADLSGFSDVENKDLYISKAIHKAVIEVNEEGTEAAAATGFFAVTYCANFPPNQFTVDRPFTIIIRDKKLNAILFIGSIKEIE